MDFIADTHTHSLACDHAYSTITENAQAAAEKGIKFLCMTEHTPAMPGAPSQLYFGNLRCLPRFIHGVCMIRGAEVNILGKDGALDLPDGMLKILEWVIASMHTTNLVPTTLEDHTEAWLAIARNPLVDVIGHCGDSRFPFDMERVFPVFAQCGKIVEINSHSFKGRPGSTGNCRRAALLCKEHRIPVVVSSDAHYCNRIGDFAESTALLEEIGFPQELVLNANYDRFLAVLREKSGKTLTDQ